MKVVIKTSKVAGESPSVFAFYPDESNVSAKAHGEDMTVLTIPSDLLVIEAKPGMAPSVRLIEGWREKAGSVLLQAEATRRINDVLPLDEQALALHEMIEALIRHGPDVSQWPEDAKNRKAEFDQRWNYVYEVRERARAGVAEGNPTSDKGWPTRVK